MRRATVTGWGPMTAVWDILRMDLVVCAQMRSTGDRFGIWRDGVVMLSVDETGQPAGFGTFPPLPSRRRVFPLSSATRKGAP